MTAYVGSNSITDDEEKNFGWNMFQEIVEYISDNLEPDQVYHSDILQEWCKSNFLNPDEIYDDVQLGDWARENGFAEEEECS